MEIGFEIILFMNEIFWEKECLKWLIYSICQLFLFIEQLMHMVNISFTNHKHQLFNESKEWFFAHNSDQKVLGFKGFKLDETDDNFWFLKF